MLNDPSGAAALRLVREAVALHDAPLAPPPFIINDTGCFQAVQEASLSTTARGSGETAHSSQYQQRVAFIFYLVPAGRPVLVVYHDSIMLLS